MPDNKNYLKIPDKQRFGAIPDNKPRQGPVMPPEKNPNMDLGREDARILRELNQRFPRLVPMPEELASKEHLLQVMENVTTVLNETRQQVYSQSVKNDVNVELKGGKANLRIPPAPTPIKVDKPPFFDGPNVSAEVSRWLHKTSLQILKAEKQLMDINLAGILMNQPRFLDGLTPNTDLDYPGLAKNDPRRRVERFQGDGRIFNLGPGRNTNFQGLKVEDYFRNAEELAIWNNARLRGILDPAGKGPFVPTRIPDEGYGGVPFAPDGWKYDRATGKYRPYVNPNSWGRAERDAQLNKWLQERSKGLYAGRLPLMPGADPENLNPIYNFGSEKQLAPKPGKYGSPEWMRNQIRGNVPPALPGEPELGPISGRIPNPAPQMQMVIENGKAVLKQAPSAIRKAAPGVAKGAGAIAVDVASDLLIDNIKDDNLRTTLRLGKDLSLLYAAPIVSLLNLEGSTKDRSIDINGVDRATDLGDGRVLVTSKQATYDTKNPFDVSKWKFQLGSGESTETIMTISELNALLKGKSQSPTIAEGSVVPIGFQTGKSLTKKQIEAGLQAEKETIADAERAKQPQPLPYASETESAEYGYLNDEEAQMLQRATGEEPVRTSRTRPSELPTVTQSYEPLAPEPSPLRELPQISVSGGKATLPKPKPQLSEYERRRRALGPNATKAERDAVRDFGLQQWASNFPQLVK